MEITLYVTKEGKVPFTEWLNQLKDRKARAKIRVWLNRIQLGNLGDHKSVGAGVFELRLTYGPGYRVYFGKVRNQIVLLLFGSDKARQQAGVVQAKAYWEDYRSRTNESE